MWRGKRGSVFRLKAIDGKCTWLKRTGLFLALLPFILVAGYVLFELVGIAVNHHATKRQTKELKAVIKEAIDDAAIRTIYSETGNTSGTGNHVDMLSVVVFQTGKSKTEIEDALKAEYTEWDEWGFYVESLASIEKNKKENGWVPGCYDKLALPENKRNCYLVYVCQAAPFEDNIEGH